MRRSLRTDILLGCVIVSLAVLLAGLTAFKTPFAAAYRDKNAANARPGGATSGGDPKAATIRIDNFSFNPRELSIPVGQTVTWVNHDDVPHTATDEGDPAAFDSKALDTDEHYSFTFTRAGTYRYYCKVHTHMTGTVVVK